MPGTTQLKRQIGLFSAIAIVVANMVGTGIFTTSGYILKEVQHPYALLWCWLIGGIFALCGALCYGELGARYPQAGGEYVYLRESFGRQVAFLSGWVSLIVGFSAPIAAVSIAFAAYLLRALAIDALGSYSLSIGPVTIFSISVPIATAIAVVVLLSLLHCHSLRWGRRAQNMFTLFKIALLAGFIAAGLWTTGGSVRHVPETFSTASLLDGKFAVALIFVSFAYSGWNAAAYLGGEVRRPSRNLPMALWIGTLIVLSLYLLLNWVYLCALAPDKMRGVLDVGALAAFELFGSGIGRWFSAGVALGLISVLSAMILTGPRVYYAMSRDRIFFPLFSRVHILRYTPVYAIGLQAAIAIIMIITATYDKLLIYIGFTLSLSAMVTVIGLLWLRLKSHYRTRGYRTWGYPVTPLIFILGNLWIIWFSIKNQPLPALYGAGTIATGWLVGTCFKIRLNHSGTPRMNTGFTPLSEKGEAGPTPPCEDQ